MFVLMHGVFCLQPSSHIVSLFYALYLYCSKLVIKHHPPGAKVIFSANFHDEICQFLRFFLHDAGKISNKARFPRGNQMQIYHFLHIFKPQALRGPFLPSLARSAGKFFDPPPCLSTTPLVLRRYFRK